MHGAESNFLPNIGLLRYFSTIPTYEQYHYRRHCFAIVSFEFFFLHLGHPEPSRPSCLHGKYFLEIRQARHDLQAKPKE